MDFGWHDLPGPASFFHSIEKDLRHGRNVVLALPAIGLEGIREGLANRLARNDYLAWRTISLSEGVPTPSEPADLIGSRLASYDTCGGGWSCARLANAPSLSGHVLWLEGIRESDWQVWHRFLSDYEYERRNANADSLLLCVQTVGLDCRHLPPVGPALSIRAWKGVVDNLDIWLHVARRIGTSSGRSVQSRTRAAVCAALAGTDVALADHLLAIPLENLMSPASVLRTWAERLGWSQEIARRPEWPSGTLDELEGRPFVHSAALALSGQYEELDRRVWRGQVGVLFPFLEEWRNQLVNELQHLLTVPFRTAFGLIMDRRDLELGHILWMARQKRADLKVISVLERLNRMRHALAHMEPVDPDDLMGLKDVRDV